MKVLVDSRIVVLIFYIIITFLSLLFARFIIYPKGLSYFLSFFVGLISGYTSLAYNYNFCENKDQIKKINYSSIIQLIIILFIILIFSAIKNYPKIYLYNFLIITVSVFFGCIVKMIFYHADETSDYHETKKNNRRLQEKNSRLIKENQYLEKLINKLTNQISDSEKEKEMLINDLKKWDQNKSLRMQERNRLEEEIEEKTKKISTLDNILKKTQSEFESKYQQYTNLLKRENIIKRESKEIEEKKAKLNKEKEKLEIQKHLTGTQIEEQRKAIDDKLKLISKKEQDIENRYREIDAEVKKIQSLARECKIKS